MDSGDFAFFFADQFVETIQYGKRKELCGLMDKIVKENKTVVEQVKFLHTKLNVSLDDYSRKALQNTTIVEANTSRQWTYQYCTEFGWFQTPSKLNPMRPSSFLNLTYWEEYCDFLFGKH